MTTGKYRLTKSMREFNQGIDADVRVPAILGVRMDGDYLIEVPDRDGYVYARIRDDLSELVQAYNDKVSTIYGLPVLLGRDKIDKGKWVVLGKDTGRYANWGTSAYIPAHGAQHSFDPNDPGFDITWIWGRQFMPLAAVPSGSMGSGNVIIEPSVYYQDDIWHAAGGTGTADILTYNPTGTSARMVLVYLDSDGNPQLQAGDSYFSPALTGTSQIIPHLPGLPSTGDIPIAGVLLVSGTTSIVWENIHDLRPLVVGDGFIPTGTSGGGHVIEDDGTPLAQRANVNFVGSGLVAWDAAPDTIVSGTVATYPAGRIPFADSNQYLTSHPFLFVRSVNNYPQVTIGGSGTMSETDNYGLSIIYNGDSYYNLGLFGIGDGNYPEIATYYAHGTETGTANIGANELIYLQSLQGRAGGYWKSGIYTYVQSLEAWGSSATYGAKYVGVMRPTGTSYTDIEAFDIRAHRAKWGGDVVIPSGSAVVPYPSYYMGDENTDGTWRITRSGDDLVFQRRESSSWVTKDTITA